MTTLQFDDDEARNLERSYATPDVVAQRERTLQLLAPQPGERILDIGSGPGYLAAALGAAVGPDGAVHGIDASATMNELAAARCAGFPQVHLGPGDATALPFPDATFDAAVSTQVYEYVADMPTALAELRRVLRPGGRALVLDTDWDSLVWNVADRERHARIVAAWEDHLVHPRLPRTLARLLSDAGFTVDGHQVIVILNPQLHENTFSANMMELISSFVPGHGGVTADDAAGWLADLRARAADGEYLFSLNRYVVRATAP